MIYLISQNAQGPVWFRFVFNSPAALRKIVGHVERGDALVCFEMFCVALI